MALDGVPSYWKEDSDKMLRKRENISHRGFLSCCFVLTLFNPVESSTKYEVVLSSNKSVCLSKGCAVAAASLLKNIDFSVEPCGNFYDFACGRFKERHFLKDNVRASLSSFDTRFMGHIIDMNILLRRPIPEWNPVTRMLKDFNEACKDFEMVEERGTEPLTSVLKTMGKWPMLDGTHFDFEPFDWQRRNHVAREKGFDWSFFFTTQVKESSNNIVNIHIELPSQLLTKCYTTDDEETARVFFTRYIFLVAKGLNVHLDMESDGKDLVNFYLSILPFTIKKREYFDEEHKAFLLKDLAQITTEVNWKKYFQLVFHPKPIDTTEMIYMRNTTRHYLSTILPSLLRRKSRVVANYILIRLIGSVSEHLSHHFQVTEDDQLAPYCIPKESRSDYCLKLATRLMPLHYSYLFSMKHLQKKKKIVVKNIVVYIKNQLKKVVRNIAWIGNSTFNKMIERFSKMKIKLFPDVDENGNDFQKFKNSVLIRDNHHFENILALNAFQNRLRVDHFISGTALQDNYMTMLEGGFALYDHELNEISVFSMIYKNVFFDETRPKYMNYATLGFIIAHEMLHGITMYDVDFDASPSHEVFWDRNALREQRIRSQCLIHHFNQYFSRPAKIMVDGEKSLFENIADSEGIAISYEAYRQWTNRHGQEELLPGIEFTPNQLFWISAALPFCSVDNEKLLRPLLTGAHLHGKYRLLGMVSNNENFARDFNCPLGSSMNPPTKCKIWN